MSNEVSTTHHLYAVIKTILDDARNHVYQKVNFIMVEAYWNIGKQIVEEEQNGNYRAEYGKALIQELSKKLTSEFGRGFSKRNLWNMKQFYIVYPKVQTLSAQLTWSHYQQLIRIDNKKLFISKYKLYLPTEDELRAEIGRNVLGFKC